MAPSVPFKTSPRQAPCVRRALVLAALLLSGCALPLLDEQKAKEVSGPTDGYTPTNSFLKVHVRRDDGTLALLDFDRRDWHASEIARRLDERDVRFLSAIVEPRNVLNEYLVTSVGSPGELQGLRFDEMGATPEQRAAADAEYEQLLQRFDAALPEAVPTSAPSPALPALP